MSRQIRGGLPLKNFEVKNILKQARFIGNYLFFERKNDLKFIEKTNIFLFSFSLVLWEIINHKIPYHDINPGEVKAQVLNGMHPQPKETDGTPIEYQKIMEKGWDLSPTQRPTIEKMLLIREKRKNLE